MEFIKSILKFFFSNSSIIRIWLSKVYHFPKSFWTRPRSINLEKFLYQYINSLDEFSFIQIGSNDGKTGDPIYPIIRRIPNKCKGIVVEPVKFLFNQLKETYKGFKNVIPYEFAVVSSISDSMIFYRLEEKDDDGNLIRFNQCGSFKLDHLLLLKDKVPDIEKYIVKEEVKQITLNSLINISGLEKIDLLHVDAEGYDWEILRDLNFDFIKPRVIIFEHSNLDPINYMEAVKFFKFEGYFIYECFNDTICILT